MTPRNTKYNFEIFVLEPARDEFDELVTAGDINDEYDPPRVLLVPYLRNCTLDVLDFDYWYESEIEYQDEIYEITIIQFKTGHLKRVWIGKKEVDKLWEFVTDESVQSADEFLSKLNLYDN